MKLLSLNPARKWLLFPYSYVPAIPLMRTLPFRGNIIDAILRLKSEVPPE